MKKTGFTLVEAMVCMAILSFMMMAAYGILHAGNALTTRDNNLLEMQQQARNSMDRISKTVRQASAHTITIINATSDRITFTTPTTSGASFYLNGTDLMWLSSSVATPVKIANSIYSLKFTNNAPRLTVNIQAQKVSFNRNFSFLLTEKVRLRNE